MAEKPFGGIKDSGYGSEGGPEAMEGDGNAEQVLAMGCAPHRDGMQGENHSHSPSYGADLQRRRPPAAGMQHALRTCSALPHLNTRAVTVMNV